MAVYTVLDQHDIEAIITPFGIGPVLQFEGAADGIENTTYFITTDHSQSLADELTADEQHYVLTIFEELEAQSLDFYVSVIASLESQGLPVPAPLRDYNGNYTQTVQGKPALLFPKAEGSHPGQLTLEQCREIGGFLARMHRVSRTLDLDNPGNRSFDWLKQLSQKVMDQLDEKEQQLLSQEISHFEAVPDNLPRGVIHNDLFRDNTLFLDNQLNAVIDFYNAGNGLLLSDLAIVVNDWCSEPDGSINPERYQAVVEAYHTERPFVAAEQTYWNDVLRISATRFWVSRLAAQLVPKQSHRTGSLVQYKDPSQYKAILLQHITASHQLPMD
jgi:homoserine kinase type II